MSSSIWVFPGQGSQYKGMGEEVFNRFPALVREADRVLGYSIQSLCLDDSEEHLNNTAYTQPALFVVSSLMMLAAREDGVPVPDAYLGHSLGEFVALFAADAFDFATGVALVKKRGELMADAPHGAMAAIIGINHPSVRELLDEAGLQGIDIANINSHDQTVISGLYEDIAACESVIENAGARYIRLKVSAAFHSRYMSKAEAEFRQFSNAFEFKPLRATVISNYTAEPYPSTDYLDLLTHQISHPVRWYESISGLLAKGPVTQYELGPGEVLSGLFKRIKAHPLQEVSNDTPPLLSPNTPSDSVVKHQWIFMYSGQGSQYVGMGRQLYQQNAAFRAAMDHCDLRYYQFTGRHFLSALYESRDNTSFSDIQITHIALFSIGFSLTRLLAADGFEPDGVIGYSLGEYIAAVVAGVLTLEEAILVIARQAAVLDQHLSDGAMLSVLAPEDHIDAHPSLYANTFLACRNFPGNFVVSGSRSAVESLQQKLSDEGVPCQRLPVDQAFHSPLVAPIEKEVLQGFDQVSFKPPKIPLWSACTAGRIDRVDADHFWQVMRQPVDFSKLLSSLSFNENAVLVDLGPTGSLSTFMKYSSCKLPKYAALINQFGRNLETVASLESILASHMGSHASVS